MGNYQYGFFIIEIQISYPPRYHEYIIIIIYNLFWNNKIQSCLHRHPLKQNLFLFSLSIFVMKITIEFLCKHSSMLTSSIIDVEGHSNYSLNAII